MLVTCDKHNDLNLMGPRKMMQKVMNSEAVKVRVEHRSLWMIGILIPQKSAVQMTVRVAAAAAFVAAAVVVAIVVVVVMAVVMVVVASKVVNSVATPAFVACVGRSFQGASDVLIEGVAERLGAPMGQQVG